ncbi:MAG: leucine-rich repeat protein [Porphyromonadaceae bacterium]|nr:leucine-rich repeat protein [Porphyromonadaceae bacterium]
MKPKIITTLSFIFLCVNLFTAQNSVYDFSAMSGENRVYYKITHNVAKLVEVSSEIEYYDGSEVYSSDNNKPKGHLVIPPSVTYQNQTYTVVGIGERALFKCAALTSVDLPESLTEIGLAAFNGTGLVEVEVPEGVKRIQAIAFASCPGLTTITLPSTIEFLGKRMFQKTNSLSTIYCKAPDPSKIEMDEERYDGFDPIIIGVFYNFDNIKNCTLHVPLNSVEFYKKANQWKAFSKFEEEGFPYPLWVAGVRVTTSNYDLIGGTDSGISGTISFNENTNTLTLDGATINNPEVNYGISSKINGLKINLKNENKIISGMTGVNFEYSGSIKGYTDADILKIEAEYDAIYCNGSELRIEGGCTLIGDGEVGIAGNKSTALYIDRSVVKMTGKSDGSIIDIASLTITGNDYGITSPVGAAYDSSLKGVAINGALVKNEVVIDKLVIDKLYEVKLENAGNNKLDVIRVVRDFLGITLGDARNLVDAAPVVLAKGLTKEKAEEFKTLLEAKGATVLIGLETPPEEPTTLSVVLENAGNNKLEVIYVVRDFLGIGLKEAKNLVDAAPVVLAKDLPKERAEEFKALLEAKGATVKLTGNTGLVSLTEQGITLWSSKGVIHILSSSKTTAQTLKAQVYSLQGSLIRDVNIDTTHFQIGELEPNIYVVRIGNGVQKVVVK